MRRIDASVIGVLSVLCLLAGRPNNARCTATDAVTPKALPAEYRALTRILAQPMDVAPPSKATTRPSPNLTDAIAQARATVIDLRQIHSADDGINQIAIMAINATEDLSKRIEDLDVSILSKPKREGTSGRTISSAVETLAKGIPHLRLILAAGDWLSAEEQKNSGSRSWIAGVQSELAHIVDDSHQLDAAAMLLPKIAAKYSAPVSPNDYRITMQFNEAWGPLSDDVLELVNSGPDLEDCTIAVELVGANGESRTNVHFIPKWASKGGLIARYSQGQTVLGQTLGKTTVGNAQSVTVLIQSSSFSTHLSYAFDSRDHDKTVAEVCKSLKLTGSFVEKKSLLGHPTYEASITMDGPAFIPAGQIDLTLHSGAQTKSFSFPFKSWKKGEAKLFPKIPFNPDSTDVVITFPDTTYRYETKVGD